MPHSEPKRFLKDISLLIRYGFFSFFRFENRIRLKVLIAFLFCFLRLKRSNVDARKFGKMKALLNVIWRSVRVSKTAATKLDEKFNLSFPLISLRNMRSGLLW